MAVRLEMFMAFTFGFFEWNDGEYAASPQYFFALHQSRHALYRAAMKWLV